MKKTFLQTKLGYYRYLQMSSFLACTAIIVFQAVYVITQLNYVSEENMLFFASMMGFLLPIAVSGMVLPAYRAVDKVSKLPSDLLDSKTIISYNKFLFLHPEVYKSFINETITPSLFFTIVPFIYVFYHYKNFKTIPLLLILIVLHIFVFFKLKKKATHIENASSLNDFNI